jgi:hypothetical protein
MRSLAEVTWEEEVNEETVIKKGKVWVLHWGLRYQVINDIAVSYSVAICENYDTGQIEMYDPTQLRILGTEVKR